MLCLQAQTPYSTGMRYIPKSPMKKLAKIYFMLIIFLLLISFFPNQTVSADTAKVIFGVT
jgi:hypothetical protein